MRDPGNFLLTEIFKIIFVIKVHNVIYVKPCYERLPVAAEEAGVVLLEALQEHGPHMPQKPERSCLYFVNCFSLVKKLKIINNLHELLS